MSMATVRADVCYRYDSAEGCEIVIKLPQDVGRRLAVDVCDAVERAAFTVLASEPERACEGLPCPARPEPERLTEPDGSQAHEAEGARPAEWPSVGVVTASEIVAFWNIGKSSFRQRVRDGVFSGAASCPDRAPNAPKVWDAAEIGRELAANGYVRRGF